MSYDKKKDVTPKQETHDHAKKAGAPMGKGAGESTKASGASAGQSGSKLPDHEVSGTSKMGKEMKMNRGSEEKRV